MKSTHPYIDIHTHHRLEDDFTHFRLLNHIIAKEAQLPFFPTMSAGLHPWYITASTYELDLNQLASLASQPFIKAIGECGLDKVTSTDWTLQVKAFRDQIELANQLQKPLIIHCVRAYEEVVQQLKWMQNKVPVIFHGFQKSKELALALTKKGYYLSFGKALQYPSTQNVIGLVPLQQIFLETDDAAITIEEVYYWAAQSLSITLPDLQNQLFQNLKDIHCY